LKSINKYYSNNFKFNNEPDTTIVTKWDYYYSLNVGKFSGPLQNKLRYEYVFKSDTCRWINIIPGRMDSLEEIMPPESNRVKFFVDIKKKQIQASAN
jgi:hypothetical protein